MDTKEIVKIICDKTGLSETAAKEVVMLVVKHLKGKLPGPIGTAIDGAMGLAGGGDDAKGGEGAGGMLGDLTKGLGKMLGGN